MKKIIQKPKKRKLTKVTYAPGLAKFAEEFGHKVGKLFGEVYAAGYLEGCSNAKRIMKGGEIKNGRLRKNPA